MFRGGGMPSWALALRLMGLGWYVAGSIVGGIVAGMWLDRWVGTRFLFVLLGVLLGSTVVFYGLYKMVRSALGQK